MVNEFDKTNFDYMLKLRLQTYQDLRVINSEKGREKRPTLHRNHPVPLVEAHRSLESQGHYLNLHYSALHPHLHPE